MSLISTRRIALATASLAITAGLIITTAVHASPITPQFDTFGKLIDDNGNDDNGNKVEFGGDGIPNQSVAITRIQNGGNTITLGLTAHQRGATSSPVGNDGAGTFFSQSGEFPNGNADDNRALWNFGFYASIEGDYTLEDYDFQLLYDFDPAANTDESDLGAIDAALFATSVNRIEDSQNLRFNYLANSVPDLINAPQFNPLDPNAIGEYTFSLRACAASEVEPNSPSLLGQSAIRVDVGRVRQSGA